MALTDTFAKNIKPSGAPAGGKYWRMNYRFTDKRKALALGVYPAVFAGQSPVAARQGAGLQRTLLHRGGAQTVPAGVCATR